MSNKDIKPNKKERYALGLFYNRFYDLYGELNQESFYEEDPRTRFYRIRDIFSVYKELISYEPIRYYLKYVKGGGRPPLEGLIVDDLFSFVRNTLLHYPLFDDWNSVFINESLATWSTAGTIHKFLKASSRVKIDGCGTIRYRIWEKSKEKMTYIQLHFPQDYGGDKRIYLKDVVSERDGVKLCISFMKEVLDVQVESDEEPDIVIMSQVYVPKT